MRRTVATLLFLTFALPMFGQCNVSLWNHVYRRTRLKVINSCVTLTGTVVSMQPEPDGDVHVRLKPDAKFASLLNALNKSKAGGALVIEPVCDHRPTQADAISACLGFSQHFAGLKVGHHVKVTGAYVTDTGSGKGWREIHPITAVVVIP